MKIINLVSVSCIALISTFAACDDPEDPNNPAVCTSGPEVCGCEALTSASASDGALLLEDTCYYVGSPVLIQSGELRIEPGVKVYLGPNSGLGVSDGASISVEGTPEKPVLFTSTEKQPEAGNWNGISIDSSASTNKIDHAILEFGGAGRSMIDVGGRLTLSNSLLRGSKHAMSVSTGADIAGFSGNTFEGNDKILSLTAQATGGLASDTAFVDNKVEYIEVTDSTISNEVVTPKLSIPYRFTQKTLVSASWTIEKGSTLEFTEDVSVQIVGEGSLTAIGEELEPITFRGVDSARGYWDGLTIETNKTANAFDYVIFDGAGSQWTGSPTSVAGLFLNEGTLQITNSTFRNNDGAAIFTYGKCNIDGFSGNTFGNNEIPLWIGVMNVASLDGTSTYDTNDNDVIRVGFGNNDAVTKPQTWRATAVPYLITERFYAKAALEIESGATLMFNETAEIRVTDEGSLKAVGTATQRITFTGADTVKGFWPGLYFNTSRAENRLDFVDISYAGKDQSKGSVFVHDLGAVTLDHLKIAHSGGPGIVFRDGAVTCSNATFDDCDGVDVYDDRNKTTADVCM